MAPSPIRVAIIGGGLGGTILMNALSKYAQLDVQLYEANSELKERGASIGLMHNAQKALTLLGMGDIVKRAKGVELPKFRINMGEGPDAQTRVIDLQDEVATVHRASLLKELTATIPKDHLNFGKSLQSITGDTLNFKDGTKATADVIIGADGIHSKIREYVLGKGHPAVEPKFAGFWDCRALVPADEAIAKLGRDRIDKDDPVQNAYIGNKAWCMLDLIEDGKLACIVAAGQTPADWDRSSWKATVSREWLDAAFKGFGKFGNDMLDVLSEGKQEIPAYVQWASAEAPKLYNEKVGMIGDAAHATTPWMGSGLAVAIEDCLILQSVLGRCNRCEDIPAAFEAYDRVMRPRGQRIIDASAEHGLINTGAKGLDPKTLAEEYRHRWDFITKWNTEEAVQNAINSFEELRAAY